MKHFIFHFSIIFTFTFQLRAEEKCRFTVSQDGTGDNTTIQAAVDACKAFPDSLLFAKGPMNFLRIILTKV